MQDTQYILIEKLLVAGMNADEALLYAELLKEPSTHLQLSRQTGVNRTKVYRVMDDLEKRGLVMRKTDDTGMFLVAGDPAILSAEIKSDEEKVARRHVALQELVPMVDMMRQGDERAFAIYTYEGAEGMKQMQWHELKTKGELLCLGNVTVEQLVGNRSWSEHFRALTAKAGYRTREIINEPYKNQFTASSDFMESYEARAVSRSQLPMTTPVVIYNDTVATYQLDHHHKVGVEIISSAYANTMRHVFEHYWSVATPAPDIISRSV